MAGPCRSHAPARPPGAPARRRTSRTAIAVAVAGFFFCARPCAAQPVADQIHWTIMGPASVTLNWRGTADSVRYGPTSAYGQVAVGAAPSPYPFSSPGPFWEAHIAGLAVNTVYHYSIGGGPDHTFKTPPPRGAPGAVVYAAGDIGSSVNRETVPPNQNLIAQGQPDFFLGLGDLTYGNPVGPASVDQHFNDVMVWSQDAAYMPAWGNHDAADTLDDLRNYKGRFDLPNPRGSPGSAQGCCDEDWYWFDYGNARFIAYPEPWTGAWDDWVVQASAVMDSAEADPAIAYVVTFGHRPPYTYGGHSSDETLRAHLDTLRATHPKYLLNLSAHDHNYQRSHPQNGLTHIVAGVGGAGLYPLGDPPPAWAAAGVVHHGAVRLRFGQAGIEGSMLCGPPSLPDTVACAFGSVSDTFFIANPNPDRPPIVTAPAAVLAPVGATVSIDVTAVDLDGEPIASLEADLSGLPPGDASFVAEPSQLAGRLTWTPTAADTGRTYPVVFSARNALTGWATTQVEVPGADRPPRVTAPEQVVAVAGLEMVVAVAASDPDGEPIQQLTADLDSLPAGHSATFTPDPGDSTGTLRWTPTPADARTSPYPVTFRATNANEGADTTAILVVQPAILVERRIAAGADDAEERPDGSVLFSSSDLELVDDGGLQVVGLRFTSVDVPPQVTILSASIQFQADESQSVATALEILAQAHDSAPAFTSVPGDLSSRPVTLARTGWSPSPWTAGDAGPDQRTPDLSALVAEVTGRPGWASGNAMAFLIRGTGHRTAESYESGAATAALLRIEYSPTPSGPPVNRPPFVSAGDDQTIALPAAAQLDGTASDDGLPSPPALTTTWSVVSGPGPVAFADAGVLDTQASFTIAGTYLLSLTASDGQLAAADSVQITVQPPGGPPPGSILERRVATGGDDAEESATGSVSLNSSDLELVYDGSNQVVGIRFTNVTLPRGAAIGRAYVQFTVDEVHTEATNLVVQGQATDDAPTFATTAGNISGRPRTAAGVAWSPVPWIAVGAAGPDQRTPDLRGVIQEIVDRPGWVSGNALALIITGTGHRTADAYQGSGATAALLHIEIGGTSGNQPPTVSAGPDQTITLPAMAVLDGTVSDDGLPSPPALTTAWRAVSGPGPVAFADSNAVDTQASFTVAGTYLLSLTASDGQLAAADSVRITVQPSIGPPPGSTLECRVAAASDDAEESATGNVSLNSSDLELVYDGNDQVVGIRFTNVTLPRGATIATAHVQFTVDEVHSGPTDLLIQAQADDDAPTFTTTAGSISARPRTAAAVAWSPVPWLTVGTAGPDQRTPELRSVIQEIVDRPGWVSGNALALIITGTGRRTADAYQGPGAAAPLLHIETGAPGTNFPPTVGAGPDQTITLPAMAVLDGTVSDDGLPSPPALTTAWRVLSGPGPVAFADSNAVDTQASFAIAGTYLLSLTASDGELVAADSVRITVEVVASGVIERRIAAGDDDAEEDASGRVSYRSSDLELVDDRGLQTVGLRFTDVSIPPGASIARAYIQFEADETQSEVTDLLLQAQAADNPTGFTSSSGDISARPRTTATVAWSPPPWSVVGEGGSDQRTADLTPLLQEVTGRAGWASGNAVVFIITGTGHRTARAYERSAAGAALLHVELATGLTASRAAPAAAADETPRLALYRAGPHPGRGALRVELTLAPGPPATIEVLDLTGRRVAVRELGFLGPGRQTFELRERLPAGVYLVRLRQDRLAQVMKAVVLN